MRDRTEDPVIEEMLENYRRAGITSLLAAGLLVGWMTCALMSANGSGDSAVIAGSITRLFASVFGWGGALLAAVAVLQYLYAFLYIRWIAR